MIRSRMLTLDLILAFGCLAVLLLAASSGGAAPPGPRVAETVDVGPVWAGHRVGFALLTHKGRQYVAYYDAERRMTVASRGLGETSWVAQVLPTSVKWDSHNYVTMAFDRDDHLHVSGNMHVVPLIYFRTTRPLDVTSLERVPAMTGQLEDRVTYPSFVTGPAGELIFHYRDGSSGKGNEYYNVYDPAARTWRRLLDVPFTDGRGRMNAYMNGPSRGPDGYFHMCWVWRDTPDCGTNHDLSYARSRDLVNWETADGARVELPITIDDPGTVIDPVPAGGGIINGNTHVGFDAQHRPVVGYHKYDAAGNTQIYNRRFESGRWVEYQTSDWDYRWALQGTGTMHFEIGLGPVKVEPDGTLSQAYRHAKYGSGTWRLDPETLRPTGTIDRPPAYPPALTKVESSFPGMRVNWAGEQGDSGEPGARYVLRWETLPSNQDRPRPEPWPEPSMLRVHKLVQTDAP